MKIGNKIRRLRLQRGLTQEELADRCELSKSFISLLERDLTSPSLDTLSDLLETLGTDLPTFFREKDEKLVFGGKRFVMLRCKKLLKELFKAHIAVCTGKAKLYRDFSRCLSVHAFLR